MDATESRSQPLGPSSRRSSSGGQVFEADELVSFRYRIVRLLGSGGMGEVYEAEDLELRERVALKVLRRELAERPGALELLKREVALARKVSHPHVCRLFDVGFHLRSGPEGSQRICFLTMELLQGEPLSALLRRSGPLSHNEALPLARQLAEGLAAAHEAGIVHRDFKSANVLLVPDPSGTPPRAVITDFGLARAVTGEDAGDLVSAPRMAGTPAYMAPEQLEGGPLSPCTDLYALGILLFELLTGMRPFQGDEAWSATLQRLHAPAPSPREFRPELDARWEALILRCLERAPERRFQHAREVLAALPAPQRLVSLRRRAQGAMRPLLTVITLVLAGLFVGAHAAPLPANPHGVYPSATQAVVQRESRSQQVDKARALEAMRLSIQQHQKSGNRQEEATATLRLVELMPSEDLRGRLQLAREALALFREQDSRGGQCMTLHELSRYELELGALREALRSAQEAMELCRGTDQPRWAMNTLTHLGRAQQRLGDLDAAEASFREQLRIAQEQQRLSSEKTDAAEKVAIGLTDLGDVALARGELVQARQLYTEAHKALRGLQRKDTEQEFALGLRLARVAWQEGRLDEAARLADEAVTAVSDLNAPAVHLLRGQLFLAQGLYKEANAALLQAGEPSVHETLLRLRLQRALLSARRGGTPERQAAIQSVREVLSEAQRVEWLEGQYEAGLALAELELSDGKASAGRSRLKAIERDARKRGWGRWAERAAQQVRPSPPAP